MVTRSDDFSITLRENMRGGDGTVKLTELLKPTELNGHGRMFSLITLDKGCSIGYHVHEGETETFYVIEGKALYNDNGTEVEASAGDVLHVRSGEGHAVANRGDEPLVLLAAIIYA